ncbi:MAG: Maf family nucleotide pyrophosphatase [Verrucomicrobiota bacterium JB023]|nr:Maf family nucleotide pyrophosphatase [Verrucomicrobiota bacterium JB023]
MKLILASGSPRRSELLSREGFDFEVIPSAAEELLGGAMEPVALSVENARRKAVLVREQTQGGVVLGADTVVVVEGETLGKPADLNEGREMLRKLSGRWHEVITGVALLAEGREKLFHEISRVRFHSLSEDAITDYHSRVQVLDKAGGYAIQEGGEMIIAELDGSRDNVMGLPVKLVQEELAQLTS